MEEADVANFFFTGYKEGQIVEINDESLDELYNKNLDLVAEGTKKLVLENPNISGKDLRKLMDEKYDKVGREIDNIKDELSKRKWGRISKIKLNKGKYVFEVEEIKPKDYHIYIDKIAKHLASQLTKENIVDLVKDAIADSNLQPEKLKAVAKEVEKSKVKAERGCFNLVLDDKISIPLRN